MAEQVRSICQQTLPPREIVLSDDGSDDATVDVAREAVAAWSAQAPGRAMPMQVIVNPRPLGITLNFAQAIGSCRGDLIALSDQDDVWRPDKLERMVDRFAADADLLLLHTDACLVDADGASIGRTLFENLGVSAWELQRVHSGHAFDVLLRRNIVTGATVMFRRALLQAAQPFPQTWLHDEWLAVMAACTGKLDALEAALIDYRQHGGNQIGARRDGPRAVMAKLSASSRETHARWLARAESLVERLHALGDAVAHDVLHDAQAKLDHQRFRSRLPAARWARCWPVAREAASGRYARFNRGWRAVVRDILGSA